MPATPSTFAAAITFNSSATVSGESGMEAPVSAVFDRAAATYTVEQLGRSQSLTPEGFLLAEGVRIARTGPMMYAPHELPALDAGSQTMLTVDRDAACLFDPETISSFSGKDITFDHPDDMLDAANWLGSSVGVVLNTRRGGGAESQYLIADLLIKRQDAIDAVRSGRVREVSCGYDCEYEQVKPGLGRQVRIVGNHVALVENGRCGPVCAIGDSEMASKTIKVRSWTDRLFDRLTLAYKAKDEEAFKKELEAAKDEVPDEPDSGKSPVAVHVHNYGANDPTKAEEPEVKDEEPAAAAAEEGGQETDPLAKIGDALKGINDTMAAGFKAFDERICALEGKGKDAAAEPEEKPEDKDKPTGDAEAEAEPDGDEGKEKEPVKDSAALVADWRATVSKAEILAPGHRIGATFDAKAKMTATVDTLCRFRRSTITAALGDAKRAGFVEKASGGRLKAKSTAKTIAATLHKMSCEAIGLVFDNAVEHALVANNAAGDVLAAAVDAEPGRMTAAKYQEVMERARQAPATRK